MCKSNQMTTLCHHSSFTSQSLLLVASESWNYSYRCGSPPAVTTGVSCCWRWCSVSTSRSSDWRSCTATILAAEVFELFIYSYNTSCLNLDVDLCLIPQVWSSVLGTSSSKLIWSEHFTVWILEIHKVIYLPVRETRTHTHDTCRHIYALYTNIHVYTLESNIQ